MKKPSEYASFLRSLKREWKWLARYIADYRLQILLYVVIGVLGAAMGLGVSLASKFLVDAVVGHEKSKLIAAAAAAAALAVLRILSDVLSDRISAVAGTKISNELRGRIYADVLNARWDEVREFRSGELLNRLEGDAGAVAGSVISYIPSVFALLTQFVGSLVIVLWYDPFMALLALVSAPVLLFISRYTARMVRRYSEESREMNGRLLSFEQESFRHLQTIKAFRLSREFVLRFRQLLEEYRGLLLRRDRFSLLLTAGMSLLGLLVSGLCYGWSVWRLWQGAISFGTMTLFLQLAGTLSRSFSALVSLAPRAISIATSAGRIMALTSLPQERSEAEGEAAQLLHQAADRGLRVRADGVSYTYRDGTQPVLRKISFTVEAGEKAAIVGPSGEGKTTLLRLLLGLSEPQEGRIVFSVPGGAALEVSEGTRLLCAYVPQNSTVFSGSIADNLRAVRPEADDALLQEVLTAAQAWDFVCRTPQGIHTLLGEEGVNLSEGQLQRLSIARALLRSAPLLLLDEATSALDSETEERVLSSLTENYPAMTVILTTHRRSVLRHCSRVYRLDSRGTMTEDGKSDNGEEA